MSARARRITPPYPVYRRQPFMGCLPPPPIRAVDLRPSGANPAYSQYAGARGRQLAGVDMQNAEPIVDYANELDTLAAADDVVGNGLFDPPGAHGNVHPDQGVFADNLSLPGYVDRDHFYAPSEVLDATTGRPVMWVPSGAVAIDEAQLNAFNATAMWQLPPGVNPNPMVAPPSQSTVVPLDSSWPVSGLGRRPRRAMGQSEPASAAKLFAISAAAGLSLGMFLALVVPSKK